MEDFPAFGRPTTAKRGISSSRISDDSFLKLLTIKSIKSPVPLPVMAETQYGSPNPNL